MNTKADVKQFIDVSHECADGWHTFTSDHIPGLFLTVHEANLEAGFNDIPQAIEQLIYADYGRKVKVEAQLTYDAYLVTLPESHKPTRHYYAIEDRKAA